MAEGGPYTREDFVLPQVVAVLLQHSGIVHLGHHRGLAGRGSGKSGSSTGESDGCEGTRTQGEAETNAGGGKLPHLVLLIIEPVDTTCVCVHSLSFGDASHRLGQTRVIESPSECRHCFLHESCQ